MIGLIPRAASQMTALILLAALDVSAWTWWWQWPPLDRP
jgi:hypothetical protein